MADQLQLRGGTTSENDAFTGAAREVTVDTTANELRLHDGVTSGGHKVLNRSTNDSRYLQISNNLSDLTNAETARANLSVDLLSGKNKIINGNFDVWQRETSQTISGYGSDDRWNNTHNGTTKTASQQSFTIGQTDVPGEPEFYSRTVVTSVSNAANYCRKEQRIEGVRTYSGQTVTLSFYAKADASKNIAMDLLQDFGTGGSPSSDVSAIGAQKFALTTSWAKYTATLAIPSISGKTLGSNGDDYLQLNFWFDAGSNFNSQTDTLGQQSGTFDIAQVQLEKGDVATEFENLSYGETLSLCQRYYEAGKFATMGYAPTGFLVGAYKSFATTKRVAPVLVVGTATENINLNAQNYSPIGISGFRAFATTTATGSGYYTNTFAADSEL